MPNLTIEEHDAVVDVLKQYVDSIDVLLRMHPDAKSARAKREQMLGILTKLQAPDPLVTSLEQLPPGSLRAHLKLRPGR